MAQVNLLHNLEAFSIVHVKSDEQSGPQWEPFEYLKCGPMPNKTLLTIFDEIFSGRHVDMAAINEAYQRTARFRIGVIDQTKSVGFKMRMHAPSRVLAQNIQSSPQWLQFFQRRYNQYLLRDLKQKLFPLFREHQVVVFMAVRQDILRWALSTYHGDGTHSYGHLQGDAQAEQTKIHVDIDRLNDFILRCKYIHNNKRDLVKELTHYGVQVEILRYEDFAADAPHHIMTVCKILGVNTTKQDIDDAFAAGIKFKKVHAHDISTYVENYTEVLDHFGDCHEAW